MKQGKAPQRINGKTGKLESKELHHKIPRRKGQGYKDSKGNIWKKIWPNGPKNKNK